MKVAVIGTGASGLVAMKCCVDEGITPVCFEKESKIGGLWRYEPGRRELGTVYKSTVINTSKEIMCFSDFPVPKEFPNFMHNATLMEYFKMYYERFQLESYVQFNTEVISCKQAEGFDRHGQWKVTTRNVKTSEEKSEYFDGVLVCIGHHAIPYYPWKEFQGIEKFKGKRLHSHDYRDYRGFEDKKVAVIGLGNSGGDIAVELSRHAQKTFLSTRRGAWVLNRISDNGLPLDVFGLRRAIMLIPHSLANSIAERRLNQRFDHDNYGLKPEHRFLSQHPCINDDLPNRIVTGLLVVKPNIKHFTETGVVFEDGSEEDLDAVIFATGYSFNYPFLDDSVLKVVENKVDLYKYVWPVTVQRHTLAIIGGVQPLGAVNPLSELQCRWATRVIKGDVLLPSLSKMRKDVENKRKAMELRYFKSRRHTIQVDYIEYMDELAEQAQCSPKLLKYFFTDIRLWLQLVFGPVTPYQYRLDGPGQWPRAREMIMTVFDRILYPTRTRKITTRDKNQTPIWIVVLLVAVFLAWYLNFF